MMRIIGITGKAGAGKDTVADILVRNHGFVKVACADPMKRLVRDVYAFTDLQLWGPSEERNKPDHRYPRQHSWLPGRGMPGKCACCGESWSFDQTEPRCFLTPRYALQLLGTEWGRHCFNDTWINKAIADARDLLNEQLFCEFAEYEAGEVVGPQRLRAVATYDASRGIRMMQWLDFDERKRARGVVISDVRFDNEAKAIRAAGGQIWLKNAADAEFPDPHVPHPSEAGISADLIDGYIQFRKDGTAALPEMVAGFITRWEAREA